MQQDGGRCIREPGRPPLTPWPSPLRIPPVIVAHLADLHLGFRQYHRQTPAGLNQREADVAHAFRRAVDQVIATRPDVVVVAGDLFHSVRPTNPAILFAFRQFQRLRAALPDSPLILIAGNHDTPRSVETGSILSLFETLGAEVVADAPRRLAYPGLGLSVLAVPHSALISSERPALRAEGGERHQLLLLHGEVEGVFPSDRGAAEYGGALLSREELARGGWSYVALGHYHVQREVHPRIWYSGALDYVSPNPWGELADERAHGIAGKGWLEVNLESGEVVRHLVPLSRRVIDLPVIDGAGRTAAELDGLLAGAIAAIPGGYADQIIRQVIRNVPRHTGRELNYAVIRAFKAEALHFQLDLRRPETQRQVGVGAPGRRQTLPEMVEAFLAARDLPPELDRGTFVRTGTELMAAVEREWAEG
jgi:DNA repair protein SbcD/Mre11